MKDIVLPSPAHNLATKSTDNPNVPVSGTWLTLKPRYRTFRLRLEDIAHIYFYWGLWCLLYLLSPNSLRNTQVREAAFVIGGLGLWRYCWWGTNFLRSQYYGNVHYPKLRAQADSLWQTGLRPNHVHFIMTTFHEYPPTTCQCLAAIVKEATDAKVAATLWVGSGAAEDEYVIRQWFATAKPSNIDVIFVRQNVPGKRAAIGLSLRALSRRQVDQNDIAILMDGDSMIAAGGLSKCLSLMGAFPEVRALTTDEDAICEKPAWMQKWLTLRFAQRRMWMQSHALSKRVLTLTGRFSMFRASDLVELAFIRQIEADHLDHWFWGRFRFLSGDDKSSWYHLLSLGAHMLYVPDAMVYTVERIEGSAVKRAKDNTLRWSGNMLRNGLRAILLGPRRMPFYIWWCLIDQRLAIWSTLTGFFTTISVIAFVNPNFIYTYILWIMLTRFIMCSALFLYTERIHMSFPPILYGNQLLTAFVKVYLLFRLPQQRWANRQDQKSTHSMAGRRSNQLIVMLINMFYLTCLILFILLFLRILKWPAFHQIF